MKKAIKYISIILFCSIFMFIFVNKRVEANYDSSKNTVNVMVNMNEVKITVRYQRGIDRTYPSYRWCEVVNDNSTTCANDIGGEVMYVAIGGDSNNSYIAQGEPSYVDSNITTVTFTVRAENDEFLRDKRYEPEHTYAIIVNNYFCAIRNEGYTGCEYFDEGNTQTVLKVSANDLLNGLSVGGTGEATDDVADDGLKKMMEKVYDIVHGTVMPIIWAVLGLFFVVKGALLGVQIVKSADEPQVRQEKVGSLKWLVIGVAISYAASFLVDGVMGFFSNAFN